MRHFNLTHDGLTIQVVRATVDPTNIRIIGHGRLLRMGAVGAAEIARRQEAVCGGLARIAARKGG